MKNIIRISFCFAIVAMSSAFVSCTPGERGAVSGAAIGGGLGAAIAGSGHRATGALIGGAVGAVAGSEMSKNRAYRNRHYNRHLYY